MRNTLLFLFLLPLFVFAQNNYTTLNISDVVATQLSGEMMTGNNVKVMLKNKSTSDRYTLIENTNMKITATFNISTQYSARSSVKSGSVRVKVNYTTEYAGKKDKRNAEYIFYIGEDRKFKATEKFVLKSGLKPTQITLTYSGTFD